MAETADKSNTTVSTPQLESDGSNTPPQISDHTSEEISKDTDLKKEPAEEEEKKLGGISLRIWPPTQKTRDAVSKRLIETLSSESILSKRYGTIHADEAASVAKSIEEEAYGVASNALSSDDDGIKILELYSKEISKRMLETMKNRHTTKPVGDDATDVSKDDATEVSKDEAAPESVKSEED